MPCPTSHCPFRWVITRIAQNGVLCTCLTIPYRFHTLLPQNCRETCSIDSLSLVFQRVPRVLLFTFAHKMHCCDRGRLIADSSADTRECIYIKTCSIGWSSAAEDNMSPVYRIATTFSVCLMHVQQLQLVVLKACCLTEKIWAPHCHLRALCLSQMFVNRWLTLIGWRPQPQMTVFCCTIVSKTVFPSLPKGKLFSTT